MKMAKNIYSFKDNLSNYCDMSSEDIYNEQEAILNHILHQETRALLEQLLHMLADQGEEAVYDYIRDVLLKQKDYGTPYRPYS